MAETRARALANVGQDAAGLATDAELASGLASKLDLAGGKILQIVRATDTTNRSTTSVPYTDASISVTITPQKSDSAIIIWWHGRVKISGGSNNATTMQITDNSNNAISGAQDMNYGLIPSTADNYFGFSLLGYVTPATTSAVTYKGRYAAVSGATVQLGNASATGQMYAIEVSA
jgi:hypothetical protein